MFSDVLLAQPLIKEKFNEALDIMNRAVSSGMGWYYLSHRVLYNQGKLKKIYTLFAKYLSMFSLHNQPIF